MEENQTLRLFNKRIGILSYYKLQTNDAAEIITIPFRFAIFDISLEYSYVKSRDIWNYYWNIYCVIDVEILIVSTCRNLFLAKNRSNCLNNIKMYASEFLLTRRRDFQSTVKFRLFESSELWLVASIWTRNRIV